MVGDGLLDTSAHELVIDGGRVLYTYRFEEVGFVLTGSDVRTAGDGAWMLDRDPILLETSIPGIFAADDVRHGSGKRVATAVGEPSGAPGMIMVLGRVTFPAGAQIPSHTHPGATLVYVESGAFGITVLEGAGVVTRAVVDRAPGPVEEMEIGVELILNPGDTFFEDLGSIHVARNAADGDTVVITSQLLEAGMPGLIPATPTS